MKNSVTIWSEGTRIAADLFVPNEHGKSHKHPAILLCHGWGGLKQQLSNSYAPLFTKSGFVTLTFDYRGWGESDGKIIGPPGTPPLTKPGDVMLATRVIREVVDPFDQILDIQSALDFLVGEASVDPERLGIWGSSYGAGHAIVTAATDNRIRCVVVQVGSYGMPDNEEFVSLANARASQKARGELDPPIPQGIDPVPGLAGTPDFAKMRRYRPRDEYAARVRVPTLVIDAEREELIDIREHGRAVYDILLQRASAKYQLYPCTHYEIYDKYYKEASELACEWFVDHLLT